MAKVLVACEESQAVCKAFREQGHLAYSCDIQDCSGGHPEWHIMGDVLEYINGNCSFVTRGGGGWEFIQGNFDLVIAFPPCTHLAVSGARWFREKQMDFRQQKACVFFMRMVLAEAEHIAVENPIGIMSKCYRKPDQIIQPWQFGHPETKSTCLWLKNLPKLQPTDILEKPECGWANQSFTADGRYKSFVNYDDRGKIMAWNDPETAKLRSKTYEGIAKAMAEQWGELI